VIGGHLCHGSLVRTADLVSARQERRGVGETPRLRGSVHPAALLIWLYVTRNLSPGMQRIEFADNLLRGGTVTHSAHLHLYGFKYSQVNHHFQC
jgi:hypothetical protein